MSSLKKGKKYWVDLPQVNLMSEFQGRIAKGFKLSVYFPLQKVPETTSWNKLLIFLVFMWRSHIPKLEIIFPSEVLVSSDNRPNRNVMFDNGLALQSSSFCNRALQAFVLRDMKMAARKDCRVGQKMSYRFGLC